MKKGFTLIELLVVIAIIAILAALIYPAFATKIAFQAELIEKWTDLDNDGMKLYRARTRTEEGDIETWNSYWVHDKIHPNQWYKFEKRASNLVSVEPL